MSTTRTVSHDPRPGFEHDSGTVLVAVYGHRDGWDAVDWAAAEAGARGAAVRVVHVTGLPWALDAFGATAGLRLAAGDSAQRVLDEAEARVHAVAPSVPVSTELLTGRPAAAIARAGRRAALVVLGQRDPARDRSGASVAAQVATRTRGTVVVVGLSPEGTHGPSADRVVVAYDGSRAATPALAVAFHAARSRGVDLTVLRTSDRPGGDDRLTDWRHAFPHVHVREQVVTDPLGLVAESRGAALLVVSSPTRGWGHRSRRDEPALAAFLDAAHSPVVLVPAG
jgi:hypothetical protein